MLSLYADVFRILWADRWNAAGNLVALGLFITGVAMAAVAGGA